MFQYASEIEQYQCPYCEKHFAIWQNIRDHIKMKHGIEAWLKYKERS